MGRWVAGGPAVSERTPYLRDRQTAPKSCAPSGQTKYMYFSCYVSKIITIYYSVVCFAGLFRYLLVRQLSACRYPSRFSGVCSARSSGRRNQVLGCLACVAIGLSPLHIATGRAQRSPFGPANRPERVCPSLSASSLASLPKSRNRLH